MIILASPWGAGQRDFAFRTENRDRGPQLMSGVGHESSLLLGCHDHGSDAATCEVESDNAGEKKCDYNCYDERQQHRAHGFVALMHGPHTYDVDRVVCDLATPDHETISAAARRQDSAR